MWVSWCFMGWFLYGHCCISSCCAFRIFTVFKAILTWAKVFKWTLPDMMEFLVHIIFAPLLNENLLDASGPILQPVEKKINQGRHQRPTSWLSLSSKSLLLAKSRLVTLLTCDTKVLHASVRYKYIIDMAIELHLFWSYCKCPRALAKQEDYFCLLETY